MSPLFFIPILYFEALVLWYFKFDIADDIQVAKEKYKKYSLVRNILTVKANLIPYLVFYFALLLYIWNEKHHFSILIAPTYITALLLLFIIILPFFLNKKRYCFIPSLLSIIIPSLLFFLNHEEPAIVVACAFAIFARVPFRTRPLENRKFFELMYELLSTTLLICWLTLTITKCIQRNPVVLGILTVITMAVYWVNILSIQQN